MDVTWIEREESHLDDLLDRFLEQGGLGLRSYSEMLRLAKRAARRHGLDVEDIISGQI